MIVRPARVPQLERMRMAVPKYWSSVVTSFLLTCLAAFMMLGCLGGKSEPIRIGINAWPGYEPLYLAQELGYFDSVGVPVRILEYGSLGDARRALEQGLIQGMGSTYIEFLQAREHMRGKGNFRLILISDFSNGPDVILADSAFGSMRDLKGKKIAIEFGSLGVFMLYRALAIAGLKWTDVTVIGADQSQMGSLLKERTVAAVVTYPPFSVPILDSRGSSTLFSSADIPGEVLDVVSVSDSLLRKNPKMVDGILKAWDMALAFLERHPEKAVSIMAKREGISDEEFRNALSGITMMDSRASLNMLRSGPKLDSLFRSIEKVMRLTGQLSSVNLTQESIWLPTSH